MKLLALHKAIKKPPRSDERDGELFCGTMSPTDNIGKTTMTAGKFTFSTSVKPIFVTICAGTSEAASNRGMGVTNFRLVNDSYVPDTVISFAQDGFVPTALTYNASTGQMTCSTNSTKNGIYAVQCYA